MFVRTIFSESQNILLPNLVWWCSIMNQSHADILLLLPSSRSRAHIIKIWLFLLYFLNCWFLGNQTWSDDTPSEARVSYEKNGLLHSGSRSQKRVKCLSRWYLLNHQTFCFQTWHDGVSFAKKNHSLKRIQLKGRNHHHSEQHEQHLLLFRQGNFP